MTAAAPPSTVVSGAVESVPDRAEPEEYGEPVESYEPLAQGRLSDLAILFPAVLTSGELDLRIEADRGGIVRIASAGDLIALTPAQAHDAHHLEVIHDLLS
jgi:hypothetical protein